MALEDGCLRVLVSGMNGVGQWLSIDVWDQR